MTTQTPTARLDSAAGWVVALSAALATLASFGVAYSFGAFFSAISSEFGIGASQTSLFFSLTTFAYFTLGIVTGRIADRLGPRPVLLAGAAAMFVGLWLTSLVDNIWLAYATYGMGVGIGVACSYVPMVAVVGGWFERRRVAAMGVAVAGIGVGTLVGSPAAEALISAYGWRSSYRILAIVSVAIMLLAAVGARRPPGHVDAGELPSLQSLLHGRLAVFVFIYLSMLLLSASLFIPFVYLPDYVSGIGRTGGALLVGIIGGASIVGRLGLGALGTFVPLMRLYQLSFLTMALSYLLWLGAELSPWLLLAFAIVMGFSYGGFIALSPAVAATLFGPLGLGGVLGALYTAAGFGAMIGPPILGVLVDTGGYNITLIVAMLIGIGAVPLLVVAERTASARTMPATSLEAPPSPVRAGDPRGQARDSSQTRPEAPSEPPVPASHSSEATTAGVGPSKPVTMQSFRTAGTQATLGPAAIDSVLLLSFGGPEGPDDVMPFLQNVTRGRKVPAERLAQVSQQYLRHGGVSPINEQNRQLLSALSAELTNRGNGLACYWGNRNWRPYLADTVRQMVAEGMRNAAVVVTSAFSSYSGCRQYHEDLAKAAASVSGAPQFTRVRVYGNHPGFVGAAAERVREALDGARLRGDVHTLFTAHSLPRAMAAACDYEAQLNDAAEMVASDAGLSGGIEVVYQSRSGPPHVPWLEPDVNDRLVQLAGQRCRTVLVVPLGFVSDHMEVLVDLDTRARATAARAGITMVRARTVGTHPLFVEALVDLVEETAGLCNDRPVVGRLGPHPDDCANDCCPAR
ncbi:ferrochelatase [Candidatus Poriferisodalis sp.]|uniref:ferrochelatase n=1 Tax=Candidatus Poriferisodalis sp. TaxID=3101277 RepID=UPI003B013E1E